MRDPLSDAFEIEDETFVDDSTYEEIDLPEIAELEFVIERALIDYRSIKDVIQLVEPKNRLKYFEMTKDFLDLAKDAMYKRDLLKLKKEELDKKVLAKTNQPNAGAASATGEETFTREQMEEKRKLKLV